MRPWCSLRSELSTQGTMEAPAHSWGGYLNVSRALTLSGFHFYPSELGGGY